MTPEQLEAKLVFLTQPYMELNRSPDKIKVVVDSECRVTITALTPKLFVEILRDAKWMNVDVEDFTRLTLVGFYVQADDTKYGGSRWGINWFKSVYPGKFFMKDSVVLHECDEGGFSACTNDCNHGLKFGFDGEIL
jgi:hypothetical protein